MPPFESTALSNGDVYEKVATSKGLCSDSVRSLYRTRITSAGKYLRSSAVEPSSELTIERFELEFLGYAVNA